jgi:hypothetical protein
MAKKLPVHRQPLYAFVYTTHFSAWAVLCLLASFLLQPVAQAQTPEAIVLNTVPTTETAETDGVMAVPPDLSVFTESPAELNNKEMPSSEVVVPELSTTSATTSSDEVAEEVTDSANLEEDDGSSTIDKVETTEDGSEATADAPTENGTEAVHTDAPTGSPNQEITAISTELPVAKYLPLTHQTASDVEVTFLKSNCVAVEQGSYYCQSTGVATATRDALLSAPDSDGDLEIFLVKDGDYYQLTHNTVDDSAPYYDGRSETMVWHRLVDDRYQVMEFDFRSGEEHALSTGEYNDMEPTRFGKRTVWQRWIDDYWQIILHDGTGEIVLTTAQRHHLAPQIRGEVILWQTVNAMGEKQLQAFDTVTGSYTSITDSDHASMINPRMMMVYEAVYENGDTVTRGVDLETGAIVAISALPAEMPGEVPETDTTGEVRALIQTKPSTRSADASERLLDRSDMDDPPEAVLGTATASSTMTLDLRDPSKASTTDFASDAHSGITDLVIATTSSVE